jgi:rod shape-determining protein MreC
MENLFNRYRNFTILILVLFAQLVLLAYQVKNNNDVPFLRFWTVTAVTPMATVIEDVRSGVAGFFGNYFTLRDVRTENKRMHDEMGRLKLENQFLKTELATADRAKALASFEKQSPSKMLAARIIGTGTGANNKVVLVDRGSNWGVQKGMGVVTPDGIVGKVLAAYPTASQVLLVTDPGFGAGVISQKNRVRGVLKGLGYGRCKVDYVDNEQKVETGELFFTSGDDRVFPKGMPVGKVIASHDGSSYKEIFVSPTALEDSPEDVLVILEGVSQAVPEHQAPAKAIYLGPDPNQDAEQSSAHGPLETTADKVMEKYKDIGEQQKHTYGLNPSGARPIDFNIKLNPNAPKAETGAKTPVTGKPKAAPGEVLESDVTEEVAPPRPLAPAPAVGTPPGSKPPSNPPPANPSPAKTPAPSRPAAATPASAPAPR